MDEYNDAWQIFPTLMHICAENLEWRSRRNVAREYELKCLSVTLTERYL